MIFCFDVFFVFFLFFLVQGAQDGQKEYPAALAKGSAPLKMSSEMAHAMQDEMDEMLQLEVWVKDGWMVEVSLVISRICHI